MEEVDNASKNGYKPPSPQRGGSTIGDEVFLESTSQCDVVLELDDSELVSAALLAPPKGWNSKVAMMAPPKKPFEEDICFNGSDLVLCYHK